MAGGFGVGQLTVRLGADTKGLTALVSAMLQVQRQILQSVNVMNQSLQSMGGVSASVSDKMANNFIKNEQKKQKEITKTASLQNTMTGKPAITKADVSNVVAEKNAIKALATYHNVSEQIIREAINQRVAIEREEAKKSIAFSKAYDQAYVKNEKFTQKQISDAKKRADWIIKENQRAQNSFNSIWEKRTSELVKFNNRNKQSTDRFNKDWDRAIIQNKKRTEQFNKDWNRALIENEKRNRQAAAAQAKAIQQSTAMTASKLNNMFVPFQKSTISSLSMLSQRFRTFGYLASATLTAPIVLAGKSVMKLATDFEFAMQKIVGLTGTSQATVNEWSKDILTIGKEFGRKPQELAEGLYFIASSGIQGAQALDVLKTSAKASASGLGDTQEVANYLTSALNAYRGTGLNAAYATDVLVAAVREGKAEASGFASAMGSVLPIASKLGLGIDQVAGSMAAVTLTGSTAAQAATYLRGMLNGLMKGSEGGAEALEAASGKIEGMAASYEDLRNILKSGGIMALMEKLKQLQEEYGESIVSKVFPNIRAMLEIFSLTGNNMKYNNELIKRVTNSSGALGKAFNAVADTVKMRYDKALTSVNISLIELGKTVANAFLPVLEKWVKKLENVIKWFNELSDSWKGVILWAVKWMALAGPIAMGFSLIGYVATGLMSILNGVGKALRLVATSTGILTIATGQLGTKFAMLRKVAVAKNIFGNIAKYAKNPYVLIGAGIATATIAIIKYRKKTLEMADSQTEFAKATATVNGELKKLNELTQVDYSAMSAQELTNNIIKVNEGLLRARENVIGLYEQAGISRDEYLRYKSVLAGQPYESSTGPISQKEALKALESVGKYKKAIQIAENAVLNLQDSLEAMNTAMKVKADESAAEFIRKETQATEEQLKKIKEKNEAVQEIYNNLQSGLAAIDKEAKMVKDFDKVAAYLSLYESIIKQIAESKDLSISTPWVQKLISDYTRLKETVSDVDKESAKFIDNLNADLASIKMQKLIEPAFDDISATFDRYKKAYEDYLDIVKGEVSTGNDMFAMPVNPFGTINIAATFSNLKKLFNAQKEWGDLTEEQADTKLLNLLQAEANAFGTLGSKIEVVNYMLQAKEKAFKKALQPEEGGKGLDPLSEEAKKTAADINMLKGTLVSLQNELDFRWLNDMNNALDNFTTNSDLLSGYISALENQLKFLSETGQGSSEMFKTLAKEMQGLITAQSAIDTLAGAFTELFDAVIEGGQNMGEVLGNILKGIMRELAAAVAKMIAMKIIMAIINPVGNFLGKTGPTNFLSMMTGRFAQGGIVPPGYPNDSYPARLTSGEIVLPKGIANAFNKPSVMEGEVVFEIAGDKLVGILRKQGKKNSIY